MTFEKYRNNINFDYTVLYLSVSNTLSNDDESFSKSIFLMCTNLSLTVIRSFYSIPVDASFSNKAGHCQSLKCSEINAVC